MKFIIVLSLCLSTVASLPPTPSGRIVGGSLTNINTYPFATSLQNSHNSVNFWHHCGGTIINNRSILSAAHCFHNNAQPVRFRTRIGSSHVSGGGRLHNVAQFLPHTGYRPSVNHNHDNDIGIIRVSPAIPLSSATMRAGSMAGANFVVPDNGNVWALGWGQISHNGPGSDQLRHVQLRAVNQARCNTEFRGQITANMLCAGWSSAGRGICFGDSGTGAVFNNVVVGIASFIHWDGCGSRYPSAFARVSRYAAWIRSNA